MKNVKSAIDAILAAAPAALASETQKKVVWQPEQPSSQLPYPEYPDEINNLITAMSQDFWIDYGYTDKSVADWLENDQKMQIVTVDELKSIITFLVRKERFVSGYWITMLKNGYMKKVVDRLLILREDYN